jgi:hypothetical protein
MNVLDVLSAFSIRSRYRKAKRRLAGCCLLVALGLLLACGALFGLSFYLARQAGAQEAGQLLQVMLLIDNSNSMYEKEGVGSDPDLLRIEAARLFIAYLGLDSRGPAHRLGVIFFGGQAQLVVPLTPLADDARRAELFQLIADPPRMGWTDTEAALELAAQTMGIGQATPAARAVVLLTDGKPEWSMQPTPGEQAQTIARLRQTAGRFAADGIPIFVILLQNAATDADPEIEQVYVPLWQEMAGATPPGRFYRARHGEDLLDIYHDIVVALTGRQTAGVVVQTQVQTHTVEYIPVEAGLAQVTFVVRKSDPALQVAVLRPSGQELAPDQPGVQYGGRPGQSREEVWAANDPEPGEWQVRINGRGTVTVWKDVYPAPATPTPSPTYTPTASPTPSPTATSTSSPTASPTPLPSATPTPTPVPRLVILEPDGPVGLHPGDPLPVVAAWLPGARILAGLESAQGERLAETSLSEAEPGRYTGELRLPSGRAPSSPANYQLRLLGEARLENGLRVNDEASLAIAGQAARRPAWWLGLPLLVLISGAGWLWVRRRRAAPLLEGSLRRLAVTLDYPAGQATSHLAAPAGREVPARLDLDALRCRELRLGPDPGAGLYLPGTPDAPTPRARLVARREADGRPGVALVVEAAGNDSQPVQVNQLPVTAEGLSPLGGLTLHDGDLLQLGAYRFRYENLRRRAPTYRPFDATRDSATSHSI